MNNPAIKRLARELQEIQTQQDSNDSCMQATPLKDNLFEWHFTLLGPDDSDFSGGRYHGRIVFPADYPFSPPSIFFLTPNGRWEVEKKICLSVTGFHPESWQPAWGIRTILLALRDHFNSQDHAAIGYLDYPSESRKKLAKQSRSWQCQQCGYNQNDTSSRQESQESCSNSSRGSSTQSQNGLLLMAAALLFFALLVSFVYYNLI